MKTEDRANIFLDYYHVEENTDINVPDAEDEDVVESYLYGRLTQPLTPIFDLYGFALWRNTSGIDNTNEVTFTRAGAGLEYDIVPQLTLQGEVSFELDTEDDEGYLAGVRYRPDDHWLFSAEHNTFSLDIPLRARVLGIDGNKTEGNITYRTSDTFEARALGVYQDLNDDNENTLYGLFAEQALFTRRRMKSRLLGEATRAENTRTDVAYFSPEEATTLMLTHMLEHTIWDSYEKAVVHRLFLGAGQYEQKNYPEEFIWTIRYEHDYSFSELTKLLWGLKIDRRYYDGEETDSLTWFLTFIKNF
jgi:hypothetical protein